MATGYTIKIAEGMTFREFVMGCSRAFGYCIDLRDEPGGGEIVPKVFRPNGDYLKKINELKRELKGLNKMSEGEAEKRAKLHNEKLKREHENRIKECEELRKKYENMKAKVLGWTPPTPNHMNLKKFMLEQIEISIEFDCDESFIERNEEREVDGRAWLYDKKKSVQRNLNYYREEHEKEVRRCKEATDWVKALRKSLPKER